MTPDTAVVRYGERRPLAPRPGRDTREALLAAAHDLLATEGAGALTVRRIAAAAGMSTMNVYSRFGGKDGVLDELFVDGFRRLAETMEASPRATTRWRTSASAAPPTGGSPGRTRPTTR